MPGADDGVKLSLDVYVTYDLAMEILSYGEDVEVIAPDSLRAEVLRRYNAEIGQY